MNPSNNGDTAAVLPTRGLSQNEREAALKAQFGDDNHITKSIPKVRNLPKMGQTAADIDMTAGRPGAPKPAKPAAAAPVEPIAPQVDEPTESDSPTPALGAPKRRSRKKT